MSNSVDSYPNTGWLSLTNSGGEYDYTHSPGTETVCTKKNGDECGGVYTTRYEGVSLSLEADWQGQPKLPAPNYTELELGMGLFALTARALEVMTESQNELRKLMREMRFALNEMAAEFTRDSAEELKKGAICALVFGLASGALAVAGGVHALKAGAWGGNKKVTLSKETSPNPQQSLDFKGTQPPPPSQQLKSTKTPKNDNPAAGDSPNKTSTQKLDEPDPSLVGKDFKLSAITGVYNAIAGAIGQTGQSVQGIYQSYSKDLDADSQETSARMQTQDDFIRAVDKIIDAFYGELEKIISSVEQAGSTIARNI